MPDFWPELLAHVPPREPDADTMLDAFLRWVESKRLTLYPAQEEAILELMSGHHVVLNTPTGSGKSLVAVALHFRAMCLGQRAFYTCPIKALVSEKFFDLCELFGAEQVGMMTGDATINREAPHICCTAEILSNMALGEGQRAPADTVVMDEFHFYGDPERGIAWQIPLLSLRQTQFLLMSATLGDVSRIAEGLEAETGRAVRVVRASDRPVPLHFDYRETPLHETIATLHAREQTPAYVVSFTQRECAELAQGLAGANLSEREQRLAIQAQLRSVRFDSPYGREVKRLLTNGIGLHHAGLLPKYRRLVERLAQDGLLSVVCGTDTLGVGVNIPIRTVVFTKLCKFDGQAVRRLTVREFQQIAGRAGRKGFDERGTVVCQAPAHVIENKQAEAKLADNPKKKRKLVRKKPPERGYVHWDEAVFKRLYQGEPEPLVSRFDVSHGMLLMLLQSRADEQRGGYGALAGLIARCHERPPVKHKLRRRAKLLFGALREAGVIAVEPRVRGRGSRVQVSGELQRDFSLHHSLSLFLVDAVEALDELEEGLALKIVSLVEAILEQPKVVLRAQENAVKKALVDRLKSEGVEYEERMAALEEVTHPKPDADLIYALFNEYAASHPWLGRDNVHPKSVARDMFERYASFAEYVKEYGLKTAEGVLLRYLSEAYKTLMQNVPEDRYDDELLDVVTFLRAALERVDSSLLQEWEHLREGAGGDEQPAHVAIDMEHDARAIQGRIRAEMRLLVKALAERDYEEAALGLRQDPDDPWDAERIAEALEPFYERYSQLVFDQRARYSDRTLIEQAPSGGYRVRQTLCDPEQDDTWYLDAEVKLDNGIPEGPIITLRDIRD